MYYKNLLHDIYEYLAKYDSNPTHTLTEHSIISLLMELKGMSQYEAEETFFNLHTIGYINMVVNSNNYPEYVIW